MSEKKASPEFIQAMAAFLGSPKWTREPTAEDKAWIERIGKVRREDYERRRKENAE